MFAMFFNVVFAVFVCYPAAFCQLCFYNKDWIGLDFNFSSLLNMHAVQLTDCVVVKRCSLSFVIDTEALE